MAYNKILLALDVYEKADVVINSAKVFAQKNSVKDIELVTVIDYVAPFAPSIVDFQHTLEEEAGKALEHIKQQLKGFNVSAKALIGSPAIEITDYAEKTDCDLIVLGSHAKHGLNLVLGSVANSVLHKAKCDVLTVRVFDKDTPAIDYKKILIPTDLENDSCYVAKKANEVAKLYDAKVDGVFVIPVDTVSLMSYEMPKVEQSMKEFAQKNNIVGETSVLVGSISDSILEKVEETNTDLIVVGSHRRGALGRLFLGSSANAILHKAKTDVLVVRLK